MTLSEVLLLSEDEGRCAAIAQGLGKYGYQVRVCADTSDLCRLHERHGSRLALLAAAPGQVYAAAARLRAADTLVGIVVASNFRSYEGRVRAIRCGADTCLPKDSQPEEIAAALYAIGRRVGAVAVPGIPAEDAQAPPDPSLATDPAPGPAGKWRLLSQGWVLADPNGMRLSLTTSERDLMLLLLREPGRKVPREELVGACAGANIHGGTGRALDVMVSRLRGKARSQGMTLPLRSVFRQGYMFAGDV